VSHSRRNSEALIIIDDMQAAPRVPGVLVHRPPHQFRVEFADDGGGEAGEVRAERREDRPELLVFGEGLLAPCL
jgi:hypothetical protein